MRLCSVQNIKTDGRIAIAYEFGCDVYANALDSPPSNIMSCEEYLSLELGT